MGKTQLYRPVALQFWTDSKVDDFFTPEDKYFYLYLLTNPHTNICGCYEISMKQFVRETGYNEDTIYRLLDRFEKVHDVIRYDKATKEVLIFNWHKYNWTKSPKLVKGVQDVAKYIKSDSFRTFIMTLLDTVSNGEDTVSIPYPYPMDTSVSVFNILKDPVIDSSGIDLGNEEKKVKKEKKPEDIFAEFAMGDDDLLQSLKDFEEMRKKIKKPLATDRAKKILVHELEKYPSAEWIPILEQSIMNGWQGIFPLRDSEKATYSRSRTDNRKTSNPFLDLMNDYKEGERA